LEESSGTLNIHDYLAIGLRRKWWIVIPFIAAVFISYGVYKYLPKVYRATTLILVQPQRVPESYVRPTITASVTDRLNTISQEILSRTRLERTIEEFKLYAGSRDFEPIESIVEKMRKAIEVKVQGGGSQNTFTISYEGSEPQTVMQVTNKLASWFIEENLRVREMQAESTSEFIGKELKNVEDKLLEKERLIRNFREKNMGQLPQQLDANLRILDGLQQELRRVNENIRALEDRNIILSSQMEQLEQERRANAASRPKNNNKISDFLVDETAVSDPIPEDPVISQWNQLKKELEIALTKYTENHPDVLYLKRKISSLEPEALKAMERRETLKEKRSNDLKARTRVAPKEETPTIKYDPAVERMFNQYKEQFNGNVQEKKRLKEEEKRIKEQLIQYQRRIEDTPKREQEILIMTRDYELLKTHYQSLLDKKMASQMAENLERKQQGEQFKIIDPARVPVRPFKPDINKIMMAGAFIGLCFGGGLAWFRETWNQKFHTEAEVEQALGIPVIAVIPNLKEDKAA
jgi:polysaccharide chain length determinant protein (PEP-CTERM system associated)